MNKKSRSLEIKPVIILVVVILCLSLLVLRKYVFGGYYLFNSRMISDIIRANVPTYYHIYDMISEGHFFWSWQMGAGTSMFSHADTFFDPFTYIVFICGRSGIMEMLVWMYIVKLVCEGVSFFAYIRYFSVNVQAAICASVVYAFSGYSMIMGSNFAFGTILVYLPLILLGAEKYMGENKKCLLFISLFLTCILSYYFFYISALGLVLYVLFRMFYKNCFSWRKILGFLGVGILSMGCGMFALLPQVELVLQSPRLTASKDVTVDLSLFVMRFKTLITAVVRSISNDALGNVYLQPYLGESYSARDYFQQSTFTSGLFFYFLAILFSEKDEKKRKAYWCVAIFSMLFILYPIVDLVTNMFATTNARWMYWVALIQCVAIALAADKMLRDKKMFCRDLYFKALIFSLAVSCIGIVGLSIREPDFGTVIGTLFQSLIGELGWIIFLYAAFPLLYMIVKRIYVRYSRKAVVGHAKNYLFAAVTLFVMGLDICINYYYWFGSSYSVSDYSEENNCSYQDSSSDIIAELLPGSSEFYRINKSFDSVINRSGIPSENDAMVQGYYGLKEYNSVPNACYMDFLTQSGCYLTVPSSIPYYIENGIRPEDVKGQQLNYVNGVEDRYNLMSYLGVKYYLTKKTDEDVPGFFNLVETSETGIQVFENQYYMPLVFCNTNLFSEEVFKQMNNDEKDIALLTGTIVDEKNEQINLPSIEDALENVKANQSRFSLTSFDNDEIVGRIDVPEDAQYIATTIPYDKNWEIYIDGKRYETEKINIGFIGCKRGTILKGSHVIRFKYHLRSFYFGCIMSGFLGVSSCVTFIFMYCKNKYHTRG